MTLQKTIYLDYAAATPVDRRVLLAMQPYYSEKFYNPSSLYQPSVEVRRDYEDAKQTIANLVGAKADEIIITAGATESINLAFQSVDEASEVVVSSIEHQSVLACAKKCKYKMLPVDSFGRIKPEVVKNTITDQTKLVSVGLANGEIGTIQPLSEISQVIADERQKRLKNGNKTPIYFHTDASQATCLLDINVARLGVDMLTMSAGKIYGPKQVGLLWISNRVRLRPLIVGGGQERDLRSGTENVAGVIGFAKALELVDKHRKSEVKRLSELRDYLQDTIIQSIPGAVVSGDQKYRLGNFLNISFPGLDGERLLFLLENRGVLVATGSACAANKGLRSHVLTALKLEPDVIDGSLRLSLGKLSNKADIIKASQIIIEEVNKEYKRIKND